MAAVIRLVRHLDREGGAGGGGEGARLAGAAGVVVRALGRSQANGTRAGAQIGRARVTVVVMMGVRGARTPHGTSLQGEDGAVRWRRGAGLRRHLLIGGQLEGSQKAFDKRNFANQLICGVC